MLVTVVVTGVNTLLRVAAALVPVVVVATGLVTETASGEPPDNTLTLTTAPLAVLLPSTLALTSAGVVVAPVPVTLVLPTLALTRLLNVLVRPVVLPVVVLVPVVSVLDPSSELPSTETATGCPPDSTVTLIGEPLAASVDSTLASTSDVVLEPPSRLSSATVTVARLFSRLETPVVEEPVVVPVVDVPVVDVPVVDVPVVVPVVVVPVVEVPVVDEPVVEVPVVEVPVVLVPVVEVPVVEVPVVEVPVVELPVVELPVVDPEVDVPVVDPFDEANKGNPDEESQPVSTSPAAAMAATVAAAF